jgi:TatD DNase family protein
MLIDSHTHAQFADFKDEVDKVIKRALSQNIWLINVGTNKKTSQEAVDLAQKYSLGVFAAVGMHPSDAKEELKMNSEEKDLEFLFELTKKDKVVGIGECGLDYFKTQDKKIKDDQKNLFLRHINLSQKSEKPLIIHCRDAHQDMQEILHANKNRLLSNPGVMHFFTGSKEDARVYLDLGFYISFSGVITFARDYDKVIKFVPQDRILIETDAPYVAPAPFRGKRNEPSYVKYVADKLAEILEEDKEKIYNQTFENAKNLFKF